MADDAVIGFVAGGGFFVGAAALAAFAVWSRAGRSPAARWWVSKVPIRHSQVRPPFEGLALVLLPMFAEISAALGAVSLLGPVIAPVSGPTLLLTLIVVVIQAAICVAAHWMTWQRWVLPLWVYPDWLRETRRQEKAELPAGVR